MKIPMKINQMLLLSKLKYTQIVRKHLQTIIIKLELQPEHPLNVCRSVRQREILNASQQTSEPKTSAELKREYRQRQREKQFNSGNNQTHNIDENNDSSEDDDNEEHKITSEGDTGKFGQYNILNINIMFNKMKFIIKFLKTRNNKKLYKIIYKILQKILFIVLVN